MFIHTEPEDQGQRYEFWCKDGSGKEMKLGWSENPNSFKKMVDLHPVWTDWRRVDRKPQT